MNHSEATAPQKRPDSCPAWLARADGRETFVEKLMLQSWTAFRHSHTVLRRTMLACCAGLLALSLGGGPAYAADDEDDTLPELLFLKKMFGITDEAPIDYRERSPLV